MSKRVNYSTLSNGIRLVTEERLSIETVSIGVWIDAGTRHETAAENGIAHCLEHMVFKGTENRSARDIAVSIEEVGGHLNAYTTREHTCYYARVMKDDIGLAADMLADLVLNPTLTAKDLEREKDVILQEIGQTDDTPDELVFDHLHAAAFPDVALGRNILGSETSVESLTPDQLKAFLKTHYQPHNMVVSVVGNISHGAMEVLLESKFARAKQGNDIPAVPLTRFEGTVIRDQRDLEQVHMALALPGVGYDDDSFYASQVFATLFGGGMSSRLFQEIREERGLAYSVYSFSASHKETGLFCLYAGCAPERATETLSAMREELMRARHEVDMREVDIAKAQLKAGLAMALESTTGRMEQLGRQCLLFGKPLNTSEIIADVEAVTHDDVVEIVRSLRDAETHAAAYVGDEAISALNYAG